MGDKTNAINIEAESNEDKDKGLVYNHDKTRVSLPHSTSIWGAQLKSKDNSLFSLIASKQASINSVNKPRPQQTEKIQGAQQDHKMSCNVGARLFSGFLVSSASGVVEWNCLMKQQSNTQKKGHLWLFECFA